MSAKAVHLNYHDLDNVLNQPETEYNWAAKETALKTLGSACHSSIAQDHGFITFIKNHRKAFTESLITERTRLSGTACELVEKLATSMGRDFGLYFADLFTGPLLKVCARTNKVMVTRAVNALNSIINAGCLAPLPKACQSFSTNNKALRIACVGLVASCIAHFPSQELEPFLAAFEPLLKEGVSDAAPEVRDTSRKSFKVFAEKFPERSQMMTTTLPVNVLKYLLPDRPSSQPRTTASAGRPVDRLADESGLTRHQSSRELTAGLSRGVPSRVGAVRARTIAVVEHSPSNNSFKVPPIPASHTSQSAQSYSYHGTQHHQVQSQLASSPQNHLSLTRNHGPASRTGSLADTSDNNVLRLSSQRTRALSSGNSLTGGSMVQRTPSINLATNGGPQRVVPPTYNTDVSKSSRPSTLNRLSKVEPVPKTGGRISALSNPSHANHATSSERETSAHERAKAYSVGLKTEMNRRTSESHVRSGSGRRSITDHGVYSGYGSISSTSVSSISCASTASTSTATSTTTVSPASSSSTSPTTLNPPNHDSLFSTFRGPLGSQVASSPPESCPSPDVRHSTPPTSQQFDDALSNASAPLSPRIIEQVSLETGSHNLQHQQHVSSVESLTLRTSPLSPHSPLYPQSLHSYSLSATSQGAGHAETFYAPPSPSQEGVEADEQDFDFQAYEQDDDSDLNMSIPDHESLFGLTEEYLEVEREIAELQQQLARRTQVKSESVKEKHGYMDEDPELMDHEQLEVKTYVDEYEATLAAASCSSTSLPSSHEEE
ncbi:hypothetical protein BGZ65_002500 [Modicella reniformis]|uniref:TOG domain-containing protein n=1 Tax=Modicella reniformis TaxID=1440133 RepID=A0A9P6SVA5_9FUNG|nr:hypothetical protein BGZ65_002500 [Modicella reniformis]